MPISNGRNLAKLLGSSANIRSRYVAPVESGSSVSTLADMDALIAATGMTTGDQAFVQENNNLYIYKTNGWFKIATVENLSPGSVSGVEASYELELDGSPTVITATATDPEGFPLTWSYAVTTGALGNTATVSQTDNVFTITPSTDEADYGEFSITFSATDGVNGAVNVTSAFSLSNNALLELVPTGGGDTIEWDGTTNLVLSSSEEYTVTASRDASISVKMWGGGGARGFKQYSAFNSSQNQGDGGGGGNTNGTIAFTSGSTYIFQVGEGGARSQTPKAGATWRAGGLPTTMTASVGGTEGAGYSGIFSSSVSRANALLIAGGGGGGSDTQFSLYGGAGGGGVAQNSDGIEIGSATGGRGGTQSAGGAAASSGGATDGSALTGGISRLNTSNPHNTFGGGGGGYFGGGGGNVGGGGGGSGYFKPSSPVSNGSTATGSGATPANSSDPLRAGAGGGGSSTQGNTGADGIIVLIAE